MAIYDPNSNQHSDGSDTEVYFFPGKKKRPKPYQRMVDVMIIKCHGKNNSITELNKTIQDLASHPSENINQILHFSKVLKYLLSL